MLGLEYILSGKAKSIGNEAREGHTGNRFPASLEAALFRDLYPGLDQLLTGDPQVDAEVLFTHYAQRWEF